MTEMPISDLLPDIAPAHSSDELIWKGSTAHLGPLAASTPLHGALLNKTCCGLYLLYIGCVGLISKRMHLVMSTNLNRCLVEQIFAYQFDWRYPDTYGITLTDIDENPDKIAAIRRLIPYFFFDFIERTNGFFLSSPPIGDLGYVINLTKHLCGQENKSIVESWIKLMIGRLDKIAHCPEDEGPVLQDFETREDWERAVLLMHGRPLPLEVLDMRSEPDPATFAERSLLQLQAINPEENPLLFSVAHLKSNGFAGVPYKDGP